MIKRFCNEHLWALAHNKWLIYDKTICYLPSLLWCAFASFLHLQNDWISFLDNKNRCNNTLFIVQCGTPYLVATADDQSLKHRLLSCHDGSLSQVVKNSCCYGTKWWTTIFVQHLSEQLLSISFVILLHFTLIRLKCLPNIVRSHRNCLARYRPTV